MKKYFVYILANEQNGTLYVGFTGNLSKRIEEHKSKKADSFTKKYDIDKLMYCEITEDVNAGLEREKQLKNWKREWKIELIEKENKDWRDLSEDGLW